MTYDSQKFKQLESEVVGNGFRGNIGAGTGGGTATGRETATARDSERLAPLICLDPTTFDSHNLKTLESEVIGNGFRGGIGAGTGGGTATGRETATARDSERLAPLLNLNLMTYDSQKFKQLESEVVGNGFRGGIGAGTGGGTATGGETATARDSERLAPLICLDPTTFDSHNLKNLESGVVGNGFRGSSGARAGSGVTRRSP
ncbi:hypothetical protein TrCOL_g10957 [Triparma columacea]|uniref:Uncharacterized protein n=1 Tax=Triparma columacea TaxID=722753 RepID=A0A9W7LBX3_9STRA|nr:hypothetical protein TrCOL_g10957 [Triparma columacea]